MPSYKYLIPCIFLVLIISLGAAYASEDLNQTDVLKSAQNDLNLTDTGNGGTFEDIQAEIDNSSEGAEINLEGNFISNGSEIHINKSLTIDGHKKTTLDANKSTCFFYLDHVPKLSVNGIKFINCEFYGDSTTVWNNGYADEYIFTNCDFKDNTGRFLEISSKKATFINCTFTNNKNDIFMLDSDDLTVRNCNFTKNTEQLISRAKIIDKCNFKANTGEYSVFVLIDKAQSITNSNFIKNRLVINAVTYMCNNKFESNKGDEYGIYKAGTVDRCVFSSNIGLIFKKCNTIKNSLFKNNRGDIADSGISVIRCKFIGNNGVHVFLRVSSIANSHFENNKNCYIQGKNLVVKNSNFINDKGYVAASKIVKCGFSKNDLKIEANSMSNCKFAKNVISDYVDAKAVKNCQFIQNKCICGAMMSSQTVSNSKFIKNVCEGDIIGADKTVSNCRFEQNTYGTYYDGSNIVNWPKLLNKCLFKSNNGKKGSIIRDVNTVNGCTFINNKVTDYGMGMVYYVKQVLNSKFINNKALRAVGGAIDEVSIVKNCIFKNNYALAGGAISTIGKFTIENCIFEKNTVKHSASAIYLSAIPKPLTGVIKNCKFIKNKANGKLNPFNYPFKDYNKGTIFAFGDYKMKITIKNCIGL